MIDDIRKKSFSSAVRRAFNGTGHGCLDVIDFLLKIQGSRWFSRIGKPNARDFHVVRVRSKSQCLDHIVSLYKPRRVWEAVLDKADKLRCPDRLDFVFKKSMELVAKDEGFWGVPRSTVFLRVAYGNLMCDLGRTAAALFIREPRAIQFSNELMGFYVEGHVPCGWSGRYPHGKLMVF